MAAPPPRQTLRDCVLLLLLALIPALLTFRLHPQRAALTWTKPGIKVVVYCDSQACDASQSVALRLQRELNLSDIFVLQGGWTSWKSAHP